MLLNIGKEGTHYASSTFTSLNLFSVIHFIVHNSPRDYQLVVNRTSLQEEVTVDSGGGSTQTCFI
jgi:hypothetical protein